MHEIGKKNIISEPKLAFRFNIQKQILNKRARAYAQYFQYRARAGPGSNRINFFGLGRAELTIVPGPGGLGQPNQSPNSSLIYMRRQEEGISQFNYLKAQTGSNVRRKRRNLQTSIKKKSIRLSKRSVITKH